ncbi:hypothetical protein [uncultured Umboniibacter sp.]|uniref:hypothetical protein n=1 Tax=uncultured Umboniibacter sp. TaxID=1798917 RepID=UPI0026334B40|nr:hypothetical protein [uncultured Umboniibacter sp.]
MRLVNFLFIAILLNACTGTPVSLGPVSGGMLLQGSGERIDFVDVYVEDEVTSLLVATSWRLAEQHVVFMDPLGKVIAEASWYGERWLFTGFAEKNLPMHAIINLISWTRGDSAQVATQVAALGGTYRETENSRGIRFTHPEQSIAIQYENEQLVTVKAAIGTTQTVLTIRRL